MKAIDLYQFVKDIAIEAHVEKNDNGEIDDIWIVIYIFNLEEFLKLLSYDYFSDEPLTIKAWRDCIVINNMQDICEYYEIDVNDIFDLGG